MLALGSTLGPYVIESLLAEGGMGAVYRAKNRVTGQLRALKVVKPELAQKRDFVDRFVREATIASQLRHPNLVETLEPGIDGSTIYLPMELLEGETLAHHLKRKKRLSPLEAAEMLGPVADAVQALHDRGVVHRDLKPMNVFVTRGKDGAFVPKVIDLGTARDVDDDEHTHTGMVVGSPFYMAPEQAEGRRDIDGRADQYALGVMAYQMITGARPYESDDTRSALAKLLRGEPYAPPSRYFPGLSHEVESVITKGLARDREERFPTTSQFGRALAAAARGEQVPGLAPPTMVAPASPPHAVVPPMLGTPSVPPGPPSVPPGAPPLGTPGPFAPPPEPPATAKRGAGPAIAVALVVLALLGGGGAAIAFRGAGTSAGDMTATPLAPRTLPVVPATSIPSTPAPEPIVEPAPAVIADPALAAPAVAVEPTLAEPTVEPAPTPEPEPTVEPEPARETAPARETTTPARETTTRERTRPTDEEDEEPSERRSGRTSGAPCGAATGIPCLE